MNGSGSLFSNSSPANLSTSESCAVHPQNVSIAVLLCLVFMVGFFLNCFSLWVFCFMMPKWNSGTLLQFHLILSDVIISLTTPFMVAYFALGSNWPFGSFLCRLKIALLLIHLYGSIMFLTLISVHRYFIVVHFKRSFWMKKKKFVEALCAGVWLLMLAEGIACFVLFDTSQVGNHTQCLSIHQGQYISHYFIINFILLIIGFILPFSVSVGCYSQLARSVSRINCNTRKGRLIKSKSNKMVAVCLIIFVVCFLPLNIIRTMAVTVKMFFPKQCDVLLQVETAYYVSWIIAGANSCFDPLIYCFGSQNFSNAIRSSLRKIGIRVHAVPLANDQDDKTLDDQTIDPSAADMNKENISTSCL
ncbi:lysophosphatidic acid receptor 6 [Clupea harengus]|uniref:Lysophosphatidic acid receptor 6 n=1 Tax=Clupea harengus TaxID=7950 RepID=A0A6P3VG36_CLUHA|nr:lysophosphatidic acid receptor 6 [Clupea harengus]